MALPFSYILVIAAISSSLLELTTAQDLPDKWYPDRKGECTYESQPAGVKYTCTRFYRCRVCDSDNGWCLEQIQCNDTAPNDVPEGYCRCGSGPPTQEPPTPEPPTPPCAPGFVENFHGECKWACPPGFLNDFYVICNHYPQFSQNFESCKSYYSCEIKDGAPGEGTIWCLKEIKCRGDGTDPWLSYCCQW